MSTGNLSQGEYLVLRHIRLSNHPLPGDSQHKNIKAADLSDILELSRPSITRILNDLERKGFITRNIDNNDRRRVNIELTEAGMEALETANNRLLLLAERLVAVLGEADTDKLIELIDKLAAIYKEIAEESGE